MRLLSLEIKGFKSFARETVIHFNEDVTGIVGPNGSGKSNIIDAIRWVLGEQKSRELRLEKMQDVIFNGTKKRKKAGTAEVSILFENSKGILPSEYNIVKVTRTLFRSGESEYKLNDVVCRLKDIKNLLVDTGIGSNSYAIIELGMVDAILQDKEHARRKMFEQAAGISKYKTRKKETLSKLSLTQTDLDRVEDLLFEIKSNLKGLEKQAKRAKRYLDIKQKYKDLSLVFHFAKRSFLRDEHMAIEKEITALNITYNELRSSIHKKEAALEKQKLKNLNDEKQLSLFHQKISSITDDIRRKENRKEILLKEISFSDEKLSGLNKRTAVLTDKMQDLHAEIEQLDHVIKLENENLKTLESDYRKRQGKQQLVKEEYEKNKSTIEKRTKEKLEWEKQLLACEKEYAICANKIQQAEHTIHYLSNKDEELSKRQNENQLLLGSTQKNISFLENQLSDFKLSDNQRKEALAEFDKTIEDLRVEHRKAQRLVDVKKNDIHLLEGIINKFEGYSESIKFLHKEWKGDKILLSDVISCQDEDKPLVELVLGEYLEYFIVDTFEQAIQAIDLLIEKKRGRAHFFVLDDIPVTQNKPIDTEFDTLIQKLKFDEKYRRLISFLVQDYIVLKEISAVKKKVKEKGVVHEDGIFMFKDGHLLGGSQSQFQSNKIGRKSKLKQLKSDLENLIDKEKNVQSRITKIEQEIQSLKSRNFQKDIQNIQEELNVKNKELYKLEATQETVQKQQEEQKSTWGKQEETLKSNRNRIKELEEKQKEIGIILAEYVPVEGEHSELSALTEKLSHLSKETNDAHILYIKQQNKIDTLTNQFNGLNEKQKETRAEIQAVQASIEKEESKEVYRSQELSKIKRELLNDYEVRKTEKDDLGGIELSYFEEKERITNDENELRELNKKFTEVQGNVNRKRDKATDIKFKLQGIKQRVQIEFQEHIDKLDFDIPDHFSLEEQEIQIEKLQNRLANFGDINPMAVEAYNEMEERKNTIEVQRNDIIEAKDQLVKTMKEIETTATRLFLEAFDKIRGHFITVFRSLFTQDDNCDLILIDPENPLSSGIEIIAKPKGKRPQSLSQLSGGEKTLTASALLFSLYLLKPAPFCIFDEVDAPLDDHNVQKFTNIIRAFSQDSQFLVVTHNKATMAELDVLYGVYMEEKGVSGVSQVDFRNYEHNTVMTEAVH